MSGIHPDNLRSLTKEQRAAIRLTERQFELSEATLEEMSVGYGEYPCPPLDRPAKPSTVAIQFRYSRPDAIGLGLEVAVIATNGHVLESQDFG